MSFRKPRNLGVKRNKKLNDDQALVPSRAQMRALIASDADQFYAAKQEKILFSLN